MIGVWREGDTLVLRLYIQLRASHNLSLAINDDETRSPSQHRLWTVRQTAILIRFLEKEFGVAKSRVILKGGSWGAINRFGSTSPGKFPSPLHVYWTLRWRIVA
ncbi:MAG: hypothetical protein GPOALKHO_001864 [Sodalis sp.]|nr:MAG: hypothetical protein GPOALKHO_001864 [Sodalis sp.]